MHKDLNIYRASAKDAEEIFQMIMDLAVYEKEPQSVRATVEDLRLQLNSPTPPFHCLLAKSNGTVVGFALYFFSYSTWRARACLYLEDLYVTEQYRGSGIGYKLMVELAKIAVQKECPRIEWSVLNWNQLAIDFYMELGAVALDEWTRYRLNESQIKQLSKG
jgi:GNAT superfamily N-acetyltransferase